MRRTTVGLIIMLALSILAAPLALNAQQPTKVYRIARLSAGSPLSAPVASWEPFRQRLRELGYVEGQNLVTEYHYAEGKPEHLADPAAELVRRKVDVIVAMGAAASRAAQHATRTLPIVMEGVLDPVAQGLVTSLAHPGGNTTGVTTLGTGLPGKRLELLKETVPQISRVAVLANPTAPAYGFWMSTLTEAAPTLGLQLHILELHRADELAPAFAAMTRQRANVLLVLEDPIVSDLRIRIIELAAQHRLPAIYSLRVSVEAGGLMSYGASLHDMLRRVADQVGKLLQGAKPADLPVEQPTKFELVINLKSAQALGLTIPPTVLFQADEVIR